MTEVTKEMEDAGIVVLKDLQGEVSNAMIVREIYRAMQTAASPEHVVQINVVPACNPHRFKGEVLRILAQNLRPGRLAR